MVVIGLVEEDVFPVLYSVVVRCVLLQDAGRGDAVLAAQLFPELCAD